MQGDGIGLRRCVQEEGGKEMKCQLCDSAENLQEHHVIPISHGGENSFMNRITVCVECHKKIHGRKHVGKPKHKLRDRPKTRFKLDMIAAKYDVPNLGMTMGQIVVGIMEATNELTQDEKSTLNQICHNFGASLKDLDAMFNNKGGEVRR